MLAIEERRPKPSGIKCVAYINNMQKCLSDMLRYGYARVSETNINENHDFSSNPINISVMPIGIDDVEKRPEATDIPFEEV